MYTDFLHIIHLPHRKDRLTLLQNELTKQEIADVKMWDGIADNSLPCRGISRAHKQIIAWAKENKLKEVCIAEDDIQFSAPGAFLYFKNRKPSDFDLYLGGITWGAIQVDQSVHDFSGSTLYIASERFYEGLLHLPEDIDYDRAMAGLGKFIVCDPMIACQHDGYSDHSREYVDFGPSRRRGNWFS
jgi:hypothetical protein